MVWTKLVNRIWGFITGIWLMMTLHLDIYSRSYFIYLISALFLYFLIFGDSHFNKSEKPNHE